MRLDAAPRTSARAAGAAALEPATYRVEDSAEVHEADGDCDGLQEDSGEDDEPQSLDGQNHGRTSQEQEDLFKQAGRV